MICSCIELLYGTILVKIQLFSSRLKVFAAMTICHQILHTSIRLYETASLQTPIFKHIYDRQFLSYSVPLRSNIHFPFASLEIWSLPCSFISLKLLSPGIIPGFHFLSNANAEYKLTSWYQTLQALSYPALFSAHTFYQWWSFLIDGFNLFTCPSPSREIEYY
jgi:hypothetical protein